MFVYLTKSRSTLLVHVFTYLLYLPFAYIIRLRNKMGEKLLTIS
jgi:hypothetical protein